jgi:hypothetical protein
VARYLRIEATRRDAGPVGIDEIVIYPAPTPLWGQPCEIEGYVAEGGEAAPFTLTDGRPGDPVRFEGGRGDATVSLDGGGYYSGALAHAVWDPIEGPPPRLVVELHDGPDSVRSEMRAAEGDGEGWARVPLPMMRASDATFELHSEAAAAWDEITLEPAPNLALEMPYRIEPTFPAKYPDDGRELTDGLLSEGYEDGRTVGWYGNEPQTTVVDLGERVPIDEVRVHAEGGGYSAVNFPTIMETWGSPDGETWRLLSAEEPDFEATFEEQIGEYDRRLGWLTQDFPETDVRFVRITLRHRGWLMLSEVQALADGDNVALGREYHLTSPPAADAPYPDERGKLTDGATARYARDWDRAVGWNIGAPTVTVDLLAPREISIIRAHCLGGGPASVRFPERIRVQASSDGETWEDVAEITEMPDETGNEAQMAWLEARIPPTTARQIRLRFTPRSWVMVDEIEVFGP